MKYIKKFNEGFEPIVGKRKLSDNFKKTANYVLDMIESDESLHYLKDYIISKLGGLKHDEDED